MLNEKENLLETLKIGGRPDHLSNCYRAFKAIPGDPVFQYVRGNRVRGTDSRDRWGTLISFPEDQPAAIPIVTAQTQVIKDIENWRSYVTAPDLRANCARGWEAARACKDAIDSERYLSMSILGTGIFEQLHQLMTFEDTLCGFLTNPEEMHELIELILDYRLTYMQLIVEQLHPDVILSHDDFGSRTSLFVSPEIWRAFFKEPYRRLYGYLHQNGVLVIHHADCYCDSIAEDMAEIGVDIWQGVLPSSDIAGLTARLNGRMALMGGISSYIDRADAGEAEIRAETRRCVQSYGELPHFLPAITYGGPGTLYPHVEPTVMDELDRCNRERAGR